MAGGAGPFQNSPDYKYQLRTTPVGVNAQTDQNASELLLRGKDKFFSGAGKGPTYDWPNPHPTYRLRFVVAVNSQNWVTLDRITIPLKPAINLSKLYGQAVYGPSTASAVASKVLGYAVLEPAPGNFRRVSDWGNNPRGYVYPVSLRTWIDPLKINLLNKDTFFGDPGQGQDYDYPNPTLRTRSSVDNLTWIQPSLTFNITPAPFFQTDWPNTLIPKREISLGTWLQNPLTLLTPPTPFFLTDWPNPQIAKRYFNADPVQISPVFTLENISTSKFLGYGVYAVPDDVVVSKFVGLGSLSPPDDANSVSKVLGYAVLTELPFWKHIQDWPNPRGYSYPRHLLTWTQSTGHNPDFLLAPFYQTDWRNRNHQERGFQSHWIQPSPPVLISGGGAVYVWQWL